MVDCDSGYVVEEDDIAALLLRIKQIKDNPMVLDIEKTHKKFDKNTCYERYIDIYNASCKE